MFSSSQNIQFYERPHEKPSAEVPISPPIFNF